MGYCLGVNFVSNTDTPEQRLPLWPLAGLCSNNQPAFIVRTIIYFRIEHLRIRKLEGSKVASEPA